MVSKKLTYFIMLFCIKSILCGVELNCLKLGEESCYMNANAHSDFFFFNYLGFIRKQYCILFNLLECF